MTVSSLWTVLDEAMCGSPVGLYDFTEENKYRPKALAVDLSIWICEALSSSSLTSFHSDPALYLVYQRTIKLLKIGITLIFVVEGKNRRLSTDNHARANTVFRRPESSDKYQAQLYDRRSGTIFWSACEKCQKILRLLGVTVLQAHAEGEALCALLNQRCLVDGVISNDGDCFLYGAKILFTRFSVENLERGQIFRYDASQLRAYVKPTTRTQNNDDNTEQGKVAQNDCPVDSYFYPTRKTDKDHGHMPTTTLHLSREDLIAFAILTGSDLVGDGVPSIGYKKALRFIAICKKESRNKNTDTAALRQLQSWGERAQNVDIDHHLTAKGGNVTRCCTICHHPGNKRSHEEHGCSLCATKPGEKCKAESSDEKFLEFICEKVTSMQPQFTGFMDTLEYFQPSSGFNAAILKKIRITDTHPRLNDLLDSPILVMGHNLVTSREHIQCTLPKVIVRSMIIKESQRKGPRNRYILSGSRNTDGTIIKPKEILNEKSHKLILCYEMTWIVNGFNCITFEWKSIINDLYPQLVERFNIKNRQQQQQTAEVVSRRNLFGRQIDQRQNLERRCPRIKGRVRKRRTRRFDGKDDQTKRKSNHDYVINEYGQGDDTTALMKCVSVARSSILGTISQECNDYSSDDSIKEVATSVWSPKVLKKGKENRLEEVEFKTPVVQPYENPLIRKELMDFPRNEIGKSVVNTCMQIKFSPLLRKCKKTSGRPR